MPNYKKYLSIKFESIYGKLKLVTPEKRWNEQVKEVVVILSASRSGSSVIFNALFLTSNCGIKMVLFFISMVLSKSANFKLRKSLTSMYLPKALSGS